jgi:hypothetical protein
MSLILCLLCLGGLLGPAVGPERDHRAGQASDGSPKTVKIQIGYFVNDRERRAADDCQFFVLADSTVVPPASRSGSTFWYVPREGRQEVAFKCGDYFVLTSLEFDLFAGGTIVFGVLSDVSRLGREWKPRMPVPAGEHSSIVWGYHTARFALRADWLRFPPPIREHVRTAYAIVFRPSSGSKVDMQCYFIEFR